ncbi:DNA adenine methylase [Xanthomonas axonopodis pv. cajani]|uniref:Methyltransferase n=1 Tax=Xanthomonas axonopodis pv. cajani TaxID=487827 RepID=A0ABX3MFK5_9XANT|nr:DNA adenine methylase [Xanthomonas axonopodis pv. cajani]
MQWASRWLDATHAGDCRVLLRGMLTDGVQVQTCVTSPPYFGLRSYLSDSHPDKHREIGCCSTPEQYVAQLVEVFQIVRGLLADDGTLWIVIGDSYASNGASGLNTGWAERSRRYAGGGRRAALARNRVKKSVPTGMKAKDLIGVPWMLAFALRRDGWYLRQEVIWHKPNPMPESVVDRCTRAHESVFLLSKRARYYFDVRAIEEPVAPSTALRLSQPRLAQQSGSARVPGKANGNMKAVGHLDTRRRRSVWTIATSANRGPHNATYPAALIGPCILASSRPGDVVLDPFMGSGTTGTTALQLRRHFIGCELVRSYIEPPHPR